MPWSGCQHGQTCVQLNFRANWAFSPDELHPYHISDTQSALLIHVASLGGQKPQSLNLRHCLGTIEYQVFSSQPASLSGHFYDSTPHLKLFGLMLSGLVQPTEHTASLTELEHIWRDMAHPADSDTALSSLHVFLKDQEP